MRQQILLLSDSHRRRQIPEFQDFCFILPWFILKITSIPRTVKKHEQVSISVLHEEKHFLQEKAIKPHFSHILSVIVVI